MTTPIVSPFVLHFIAGRESLRDVKPREKRKYGWLPNAMGHDRSMAHRRKRKKKT